MMSATSLPIAFKPCCGHSCRNMHPTAGLGLVWECEGLNPRAQTAHRNRKVPALADGLGAGLELVEDLQGAPVSGKYNSGRHSIKSLVEMFVGFWHAPLLLQ